MRPTLHLLLSLSLAAVPAASLAYESHPQAESPGGPLPVFELRSGFWINLHHFLYQQARLQRDSKAGKTPGPAPAAGPALATGERRAWDAALAYYLANFVDRDLLFNSDLVGLKNHLGDFENCEELSGKTRKECNAGLPLAAQLE